MSEEDNRAEDVVKHQLQLLIVAITKVSTEVLQVNAMSAKDVEMDKS
jgi:hypothetical protein